MDIRIPIGLMFGMIGAILVAFGAFSSPRIYQIHSLGLNVNLIWGAVLLVFAFLMLGLARRASKRSDQDRKQ